MYKGQSFDFGHLFEKSFLSFVSKVIDTYKSIKGNSIYVD